jgi:sodium/bile acid cotransporter 7
MHVPSSPLAIFVIRLLSSASAFLPVQSSPRECAALLHPPTTIDRRRRVVRVRTTTPRSNYDDDDDDDDDGPLNVSPTKDDARRHLGRGRRGPPPLAASVRGGGSPSPPSSSSSSFLDGARAFASKNFFPMGMVVAVSLARSFPELGRDGGLLRPELFIGEYGAASVFLLSGLGLKSADLASAASNGRLNALIQSATFAAWPFLVGLPLTRGLRRFLPRLLPGPLLDGVLVLTCLPTTINMAVLLTSTCKGSVATALCNTVISNLLGIFVTPALLFLFFGGAVIELPFLGLVGKLCKKVMLPVGERELWDVTDSEMLCGAMWIALP